MIFVGGDWAEDHHDVVIFDETGKALVGHRRLPALKDPLRREQGLGTSNPALQPGRGMKKFSITSPIPLTTYDSGMSNLWPGAFKASRHPYA